MQRFWLNFASSADRERAMSRHMAYLVRPAVGSWLIRRAVGCQWAARTPSAKLLLRAHPPAAHVLAWRLLSTAQRTHARLASRAVADAARRSRMHVQGTRRLLLRKATPHEFSVGIYNPLAMSSRGRYVLVSNLAATCTSGALSWPAPVAFQGGPTAYQGPARQAGS